MSFKFIFCTTVFIAAVLFLMFLNVHDCDQVCFIFIRYRYNADFTCMGQINIYCTEMFKIVSDPIESLISLYLISYLIFNFTLYHHIILYPIVSYCIRYLILSYPIVSYLTISYIVLSHLISFRTLLVFSLTLYHHILLYLISSCLIVSYCILFHTNSFSGLFQTVREGQKWLTERIIIPSVCLYHMHYPSEQTVAGLFVLLVDRAASAGLWDLHIGPWCFEPSEARRCHWLHVCPCVWKLVKMFSTREEIDGEREPRVSRRGETEGGPFWIPSSNSK